MTTVAWHAINGDGSSDEESVEFNATSNMQDPSRRLLHDDDDDISVTRYHRLARSNVSPPSYLQHTKDEKKYKYSLVSVLIVGICLILTVNIGLGYRKCDSEKSQRKTVFPSDVTQQYCYHTKFPWHKYRLPTSLSPEKYHVFLHPNLTLYTYTGTVTIDFIANENTQVVILHSKNHIIKSAYLQITPEESSKIEAKQILHCDDNQMISLDFGVTFKPGTIYQLEINFLGNLTFSLGGFYLSKYKKKDGKETVIGATQFESTDARAAFPCFDEPDFKAKFSLSLVRDKSMHTLFNMPLNSTSEFKGGLQLDKFNPTVKMSTYLVAFIVSDFQSISETTSSGIKVSIFSSPDKVSETTFALKVAVKVLTYYEQLFTIPFPLPKMDLVAVPDFAAGAMENWGLVTYRETSLLYNPATSSVKDQEWVAKVIAHELSHQWFGNLVTMKWWNDLWLNEGFASYMEYAGVNEIEPQWDFMVYLPLEAIVKAMATDSSVYTHPLSVKVSNSLEIDEIFDRISYEKGASIIGMMVDYLGTSFFKGVDAYLKKYAYSNAVNQDLIRSISQAVTSKNVHIQRMMDTWTILPGFPQIKVSVKNNQITMEQSRFYHPGTNQSAFNRDQLWEIPVSYVTDNAPYSPQRRVLKTKKSTINVGSFNWIKFNHNFTGYYKVSYQDSLWQQLSQQMKTDHTVFTVSDRINILSDSFTMAHCGDVSYGDLFSMLSYIRNEEDYAPVRTAMNGLNYIHAIFRVSLEEESLQKFELYVMNLMGHLYNSLAWKNQTNLSRMQSKLQSIVVNFACSYHHRPCLDEAYKRFNAWKVNGTKLHPDEMFVVFKAGINSGDMKDWDYLWSVYETTTDASLQDKILSAVAETTDRKKIVFLLGELLKGQSIRTQSTSSVISSLTSNLIGGSYAWRFVKRNWKKMVEIHPVASFSMRRIVQNCVGTMLDDSAVAGVEAFFVSKNINDVKYIKRILENARTNVYWSDEHLDHIAQWLNDNESSYKSSKTIM